MAGNSTVLTDAHHFSIQDARFITHQTTIVQSPAPVLDPLEILHKHCALEASHTSKLAASAPKCKPGTRVKAIEDLTTWAKELAAEPSSSRKPVLWLRGPAGAGKTCIMRVVARICRQDGVLVGDYFFSTRVPGLDDAGPFVATIVSHLITIIPALDHPVRETIRLHPKIFEQSLEFQMEELISKHIASIPPQAPRILVVDGFDECRDHTQRACLLHLLHSLVTPPHSFRVIIASRPELDIRTAFDSPPLKSITKVAHLETYEVSGEIYQYLVDEFARIRQTHPAKQSIPSEWPGQATLHALIDKSSGIWAYPSTVIKYVGNPRRHPVELLEHVLDASLTASPGHPFAELDALYKIILNPPDCDIPLMTRLLHIIIEITRLSSGLGTYFNPLLSDVFQGVAEQILLTPQLDEFLSLRKGTVEMTLCDLHSVLSVTGPGDVERPSIYFHHKSLVDYLCSPKRAGDLYQSQEHTYFDIVTVCIHNLELWNRKLVNPSADYQAVSRTLEHSCAAWKHLVFGKRCFPPSILDFDARIVWRCFAFVGWYPPLLHKFHNFVDSFHNTMCKEAVECRQSCASFRRMLEYTPMMWNIMRTHDRCCLYMERLKSFEEQCQGLFAPLDLSPPTGALTTLLQDNEDAHLPLSNTLESGSGDVGSGGLFIPGGLTSTAEESREPQRTDSVPGPTPQPEPAQGRDQGVTLVFVLLALAWISGMYLWSYWH